MAHADTRACRKWLIVAGMLVEALAIWLVALGTTYTAWAVPAVLLASSGMRLTQPWRGRSVGVNRL